MNLANPFRTQSPYEEIETARRMRMVIAVFNAAILFGIPLIVLLTIMMVPQFSPSYGACLWVMCRNYSNKLHREAARDFGKNRFRELRFRRLYSSPIGDQ